MAVARSSVACAAASETFELVVGVGKVLLAIARRNAINGSVSVILSFLLPSCMGDRCVD